MYIGSYTSNMHGYIERTCGGLLRRDIVKFPAVVLLGLRQCGKTTLVKKLGFGMGDFLYRDLERPQDLRQLEDPDSFLESNRRKIVCLDEIQRLPGLFPVLRGFIDRHERDTKLIFLGSASPDFL